MAIVFPASTTVPPVPDGTVLQLHPVHMATIPQAPTATPLETATMTAGTCTFSSPADGRQYAVWCPSPGRWVLKRNPVANEQTATASTSGATPESRRAARLAAAGTRTT